MAATRRKTDEVLASARKDLQAQLGVVRAELARLSAEEDALTRALASLDGDSGSSSSTAPTGKRRGKARTVNGSQGRSSTRKPAPGRRRRTGGAAKSTADRVKELRALLADGPKSRKDLAAALEVSPARVQQLLGELGRSVSSEPDPDQRQGKLWSLKPSGNGASATRPAAKRGSAKATGAAARKRSAGTLAGK